MEYPHISLSSDLHNEIKEYAKRKNIRYSHAVAELIDCGFSYIKDKSNIETNITLFEKILGNEKYIIKVLEQLYADMDFDAKNNPLNNVGLNRIKNKFRRDDFDD